MTDRRPIYARLIDIFHHDELVDRWIYSAHPKLGNVPPRQLVDQGRAEEVHALIDQFTAELKET